jgi:hypothetical protein
VGALLEGIIQLGELDRFAQLALESDPNQEVRQPRILGQDRAVEVRRIDVVATRSFGTVASVVARPGDHRPKWSETGTELGQARVVLEPDDRLDPIAEAHLAGGVLHESVLASSCLEIKQADALDGRTGRRDVAMTEELQAGAHGEDYDTRVSSILEGLSPDLQVPRGNGHLEVLAALHDDQVKRLEI